MPDELFGLPVTAIGDRALAPNARDIEGEEVDIVCGRAGEEWNNKNIRELTLPRHLKTIGEYAFYNCVSMFSLRLYDDVEALPYSAFMNCRAFERVQLTRTSAEQGQVLSCIVSWLPRELDVSIKEVNGDIYRLLFPEYYEIYTENESTHFFDYTIEGAGFPYHNVFRNRLLSVQDYDALWPKYLGMEYEPASALRLAWRRLEYPAGLTESTEKAYADYLYAHAGEAFDLAIGTRDIDGLRMLLKSPTLTAGELEYAQGKARESSFTEATALLLEEQHRRFAGGRRKSFDL